MNIDRLPEGGGAHYRPNLNPLNPGKAYHGHHKVEVLAQKKEGSASVTFPPTTHSSPEQVKQMMQHTFKPLDPASEISLTHLAQRMIQN